ncbi:MAG: hypothetical protein DLM69_10550 [Candidatus Chloroheliales bacterium]|nr:MAG: hypothetical protein DLM69_10550 [Chloroflexota bacterium]
MFDLTTFRERIAALYRRASPYDGGRRATQRDLADAVGLNRSELNRRLRGAHNARLISRDVHAVVQTLVEWGAITTQAEARELLALVDCPDFTPAEWQSPPLDELTARESAAPAPIQTSNPNQPPSNLPRPVTSLIGREREMHEAASLITTRRLVTLTGAGGVGKTRLALEVAHRLLRGFSDGIFLAELASLHDPAAVPLAVAAALGVEEQAEQLLTETLRHHLEHKDLLLVLDNCEHLSVAVAHLVQELLDGCPRLHLLTTSREALRLGGEARYSVPPLPLPTREVAITAESISRCEAVQLFVARAVEVRPGFQLTADNAAAVHYICTQLDGLPLALELAAAQMYALTAAQIAAQLAARFRLLVERRYDADPRHRTLQATIDWSYSRLTSEQQALLHHLAVFSGGFTLEAVAETMQLAPLDVLDTMTELLNKSLIQAATSLGDDAGNAEPRFTLLETIREYALLKLREAGEEQMTRQAHAAYYQQLAELTEAKMEGSERAAWQNRLEQEYYNLSTAIGWSLEHEPQALNALQISSALWPFWRSSGRLSEGRRLLAVALSQAGEQAEPKLRATALTSTGRLAYFQGEYDTAEQWFEAALTLWRELQDARGTVSTLNSLGGVAYRRGDYQLARRYYGDCLVFKRQIGDKLGISTSLNNLAIVAGVLGEYQNARALFEQALALRRGLGSKLYIAVTLNNLGDVANNQRDYAAADNYYREALPMLREVGDKWRLAYALIALGDIAVDLDNYNEARLLYKEGLQLHQETGDRLGLTQFLEGMAMLAKEEGKLERAISLWGAAQAVRRMISAPLPPAQGARYEDIIASLRTDLGTTAFARAWVGGQMMSQEQAIAYALELIPASETSQNIYP